MSSSREKQPHIEDEFEPGSIISGGMNRFFQPKPAEIACVVNLPVAVIILPEHFNSITALPSKNYVGSLIGRTQRKKNFQYTANKKCLIYCGDDGVYDQIFYENISINQITYQLWSIPTDNTYHVSENAGKNKNFYLLFGSDEEVKRLNKEVLALNKNAKTYSISYASHHNKLYSILRAYQPESLPSVILENNNVLSKHPVNIPSIGNHLLLTIHKLIIRDQLDHEKKMASRESRCGCSIM